MSDDMITMRILEPYLLDASNPTQDGKSRDELLDLIESISDTIQQHDDTTKYRFEITVQEIKADNTGVSDRE